MCLYSSTLSNIGIISPIQKILHQLPVMNNLTNESDLMATLELSWHNNRKYDFIFYNDGAQHLSHFYHNLDEIKIQATGSVQNKLRDKIKTEK